MNKQCPGIGSKDRGKAEACKGCPNANACASSKEDIDIPVIKCNLKSLKLKVAIMSGKGGVGKSTITYNLAYSLAKNNLRVVLVDFDLTGPSIPRLSNTFNECIQEKENRFDPIKVPNVNNLYVISSKHLTVLEYDEGIGNSKHKNKYIKKILKNCNFNDFDIMIIDTPPNITDEHLALVHYIGIDYSILVTTPSKLTITDLNRTLSFCKKANIEIYGVIENFKSFECPECKTLNYLKKSERGKIFAKENEIKYLGEIPHICKIARNSDQGEPTKIKQIEQISKIIIGDFFNFKKF
ncbi:NBP35 [Hepatospora eriocheir]|uniref:NBP35 n=1 Tax=Hepatospora eriocheir TaxID=1081669 RepID=A0A1X0QL04_9MICR|nr:NBP35 [Hepatospora eriocheir]